jgi:hypothetical protein
VTFVIGRASSSVMETAHQAVELDGNACSRQATKKCRVSYQTVSVVEMFSRFSASSDGWI